MKKLAIFCLALIMLSLSGCAGQEEEVLLNQSEDKKPLVAVTIFPLADLVRQIGGENIQVVTLLPAGASPHTFEPTPGEMKAVSQAGLLVSVGAGLDVWGQKLLQAAGENTPETVITEGLELLPLKHHHHDDAGEVHQSIEVEGEQEEEHDHEAEAGEHWHHNESGDPHVWLDPVLVKDEIAPMLVAALTEQWPELADTFQANLAQLQQDLQELDQDYREVLASCPQRKFISFHATWGYLAHRYDLEEVASVLEYPGEEPSARWLADLTELARAEEIKSLMIEPQFNPKPAELLAEEINGSVFVVDPLGGEEVEGRNSYFQLMQYNLAVFKEALGL